MGKMSKFVRAIFWIIGLFMVGFGVAPLLCGCDECDGTEMQCNGNTIEICEDEVWEPYVDCSIYDDEYDVGPFKCCEFAYTSYCVPESACEEIIYR